MTESITLKPDGVRVVHLLMPFEHESETVTSIALGPVTFDLTLKWQAGEYKNSVQLLCELAHTPEARLRQLRYPDVDRVLEQFMSMLPAEVRVDMLNGGIPRALGIMGGEDPLPPSAEEQQATDEPNQTATDGGFGVDALNPPQA